MCDYSLMMVPNRLAYRRRGIGRPQISKRHNGVRILLRLHHMAGGAALKEPMAASDGLGLRRKPDPTPVVCIPPGARLRVEAPPESLSGRSHSGSSELATFTQLSAEANQHRDALCFDDGAIVRLAMLAEGQRVKVLRLASFEERQPTSETIQRVPAA